MWAVLAIIVFLAAQVYLLLSLKKADGFLAGQQEKDDREILSLVFAEPAMAEGMAHLLAEFSHEDPETEMVLHTDPAVTEAVFEGREAVGFLSENDDVPQGLSSRVLALDEQTALRVVWKTGAQSDSAVAFLRCLRQSGGNPA